MPPLALALTLSAALLHATWNLLLAGSRGRPMTTGMVFAAALIFAPAAAVTWQVPPAAWPYLIASTIFELLYFILLAAAYRRSEMSLVYPLARGLGPVLVLGFSVPVLALPRAPGEVAGVALVGLGVVLVGGLRAGRVDVAGIGLAMAIGACIAAYTLIDKGGMQFARPLPYLWLEMVLLLPLLALATLWRDGRAALRAEFRPVSAVAGAAMFLAYALVLAALSLAPAAPVAAVRETSVVMGVVLAAVFLGERVGPRRLGGSLLVALGVALLALG
jgi:drug/metabolite transporter (DMT)-like permease